jgi:lipoate-protein ligase A
MKEHEDGHTQQNLNPVCFEVPSTYEITVDGKKLIGSAQARKKEGVLQHGSLPLTGDLTRICDALVFESESARQNAKERLLARAATDYRVRYRCRNCLGNSSPGFRPRV